MDNAKVESKKAAKGTERKRNRREIRVLARSVPNGLDITTTPKRIVPWKPIRR